MYSYTMEAFKNELKDVITRKIVNSTEGRACIGCEFAEFPHTCGSSMKDKIESKFNQVWFDYITQNSYKIKMKLRKAILEEIFSDHMSRENAKRETEELTYESWVHSGGGSSNISSTTEN